MSRLPRLLLLCLLLAGCANVSLQEVRDFAGESAEMGGYADLAQRFRDTYQRERPYLAPTVAALAEANDARRQAAYDDFHRLQHAVVLYMQTLDALAGATRYDLSAQVDGLTAGITANPELGISAAHVQAYAGLTRLLLRISLSNYQANAVQELVRDGDADLQLLLAAMTNLMRLFDKTNANEQKTVLEFFDVQLRYLTHPQDRLLAAIARAQYQAKDKEYRLIAQRYSLAEQGLAKIALGHRALHAHLDEMTTPEVRQMAVGVVRDLRMIRAGLVNNQL